MKLNQSSLSCLPATTPQHNYSTFSAPPQFIQNCLRPHDFSQAMQLSQNNLSCLSATQPTTPSSSSSSSSPPPPPPLLSATFSRPSGAPTSSSPYVAAYRDRERALPRLSRVGPDGDRIKGLRVLAGLPAFLSCSRCLVERARACPDRHFCSFVKAHFPIPANRHEPPGAGIGQHARQSEAHLAAAGYGGCPVRTAQRQRAGIDPKASTLLQLLTSQPFNTAT
eukprot:g77826.t1